MCLAALLCQQFFADSRMEVRGYRHMDINGFNLVSRSFICLKGLKTIVPDGSLSSRRSPTRQSNGFTIEWLARG